MGTINIRKARREGARVVIGLAGVSGSGKTYSAIQLAYGLAGYNAAKVGLLDTENRRGSLYADSLQKADKPTREPFLIGDLIAPFSPARYREAILEFQSAGVEVLVIDSVTHEWEGVGGCDDIANEGDPKVPRWNRAKREHRLFMNTLLQCDMHVVACIRAREKVRMESKGGKVEVIPIGIQPVQEKNFMFELTASLLLHDAGKRYERTKVPADLLAAFPGDAYITAATGDAVRHWVNAGGEVDPMIEKYRNRLITVSGDGETKIRGAWDKTPQPIREALGDSFFSELLGAAKEFDKQKAWTLQPDGVEAANQEVRAATGVHLDF